jgi:hypothetical protein
MGKRVICLLLSTSISAMLAVGGHADTLQSWFDAHGYNINVATDELGIERFGPALCTVTVLNGEHAYLNLTGWYLGQYDRTLLFGGVPQVGATDSFAAGQEFDFYIDSGYGFFYTETALNPDGIDHACVFRNPRGAGYIVAFEDMMGGGDRDYTDRLILVTMMPFGPWYVDCSVPVSGDGRTWPTAFKTIQEGVNAAGEAEEVIVAPGIYRENVVFKGNNIVIHSRDPNDPKIVASTVIMDGGARRAVVTFAGSETSGCILLGFTIRNGSADYGGGICGGTEEKHTYATIRSNTITQNYAIHNGGGIAFCDGPIENNVISENQAAGSGGGLHGCQGIIRDNVVTDNIASYSGGGMHLCHGTIANNLISGNVAARGAGLDYCSGTIEKNTISQNTASYGGGGLAWCEGTVQTNTIRGNSAFYGGGLAWGIGIIQNNLIVGNRGEDRAGGLERCEGVIRNNTIVANSASDRGGGLADCGATIINCVIWGNAAAYSAQLSGSSDPTYSCIEGWAGGEGNVSASPPFVDGDGPDDDPETFEDNNYRLAGASPGIDAGRNEAWMWNAFDMDGNYRISYGAFSLTVDIGAYEFGSLAFRIVRVTQTVDGRIELTWTSGLAENYVIWACLDLTTGAWFRLNAKPIASVGRLTTWIDSNIPLSRQFFYRIEMD